MSNPDNLDRVAALAEHLDTLGEDSHQAAIAVRDVLSILRTSQDAYHGPLVEFAANLLHDTTMRAGLDGPAVGETVIELGALCDIGAMNGPSIEASTGVVLQRDARRRHARVQWPTHIRWVSFDLIAGFRIWRGAEVQR